MKKFPLIGSFLFALAFLSGCSNEPDADNDGVPDATDQCTHIAEDEHKTETSNETDGCPDLDTDGDGVPDYKDRCSDQVGVASDDPEKNGCPAEPQKVEKTPAQMFDEAVADPTTQIDAVRRGYGALSESEKTPERRSQLAERNIAVADPLVNLDYVVTELDAISDANKAEELRLEAAYQAWKDFYTECPKGVDVACDFAGASSDEAIKAMEPGPAKNQAMRVYVYSKIKAIAPFNEAVPDKAKFVKDVRGDVMGETPITGDKWEVAYRTAGAIKLPASERAELFASDLALIDWNLCMGKAGTYALAKQDGLGKAFEPEIKACVAFLKDRKAYLQLDMFGAAAGFSESELDGFAAEYSKVAAEEYRKDPTSVERYAGPNGFVYEIKDLGEYK